VGVEVLLPKEPFLDADAIIRTLTNTMKGLAKDIKVDFDTTTRTWGNEPEFVIEEAGLEFSVYTTDKIYFFLNRGTSVRHAVMSHDFSPKTRSGYIGSNKGEGGVVFVSRKINLPGIEARKFDEAIITKWQPLVPGLLQRAIDAEVSRQNRG
jgi:hypothetical protein